MVSKLLWIQESVCVRMRLEEICKENQGQRVEGLHCLQLQEAEGAQGNIWCYRLTLKNPPRTVALRAAARVKDSSPWAASAEAALLGAAAAAAQALAEVPIATRKMMAEEEVAVVAAGDRQLAVEKAVGAWQAAVAIVELAERLQIEVATWGGDRML